MILRAILSHYRRHPLQLLALWLILTLATALWSGVWSLTGQARDSMTAGDSQLSGRQQVVRSDGAPITVADFVSLRRAGLCVFPWLQVSADGARGQMVGIDPLAMACSQGSATGSGLTLDGQPFVDIAEAAEAASSGQPDTLRLYIASPEALLPEGWQRQADPGGLSTGELSDSFLLNLDALGVLVVLVSAMLIRSVYTLGLAQRRESLGLLERYGVTRRRLQLHLLLELLVLAALGIMPGYLLGQGLADTLAGGFGAAMGNLFEIELLATGESVTGFLVTLVMLILVMVWCGQDLLRGASGRGRSKDQPVLGALLLLAGALLVLPAQTLVTVFLGTGLLLAGGGLITPAILARCLSPSPDSPPLKLWRRRELGVLTGRLALPLVALQLAGGTVIAVHALVTTFEGTFHEWLDQRLAGDLFVEMPEGTSLAPAADFLNTQEAVAQWHPVLRGSAIMPVDGDDRQVDLMATDTTSTLIRQWSLLASVPQPWQALADGDVLVNEQLARRRGLAPGDRLTLVVADSKRTVKIAGIYADYGRPAGEVLVDTQHLVDGFVPAFRSLTIGLAEGRNGISRSDLVSGLEAAWQTDSLQVRDNETLHRLANRVFDQTFALTRSISYLTLLLAGVALLMTGWVVLRSRAWYFGLLTAWGLTDRERRRTIIVLAAEFMVAIWAAALPVGVTLTWVLVDRINPVAFGWTLPMTVYPGYWLELLLLFGLASVMVGWLVSSGRSGAPVRAPALDGGQER